MKKAPASLDTLLGQDYGMDESLEAGESQELINAARSEGLRKAEARVLAGYKRLTTGANFEADVALTAKKWTFEKVGFLWRHGPRAVRHKGGWAPEKGGHHVDWTGHVVVYAGLSGDFIQFDYAYRPNYLPRVCPLAFDCKVLPKGAASYRHDPEQMHQLDTLHEAAHAGVFAFLLVYAPHHEHRVYALPIEGHYSPLRLGHSVQMWSSNPDGEKHPCIIKPANGCDFIPLLPACRPRHLQ